MAGEERDYANSALWREVKEETGQDLKPVTILTEQDVSELVSRLYTHTNGLLQLEKVPKEHRNESWVDQHSLQLGGVSVLGEVLTSLGQGEMVEAIRKRLKDIRAKQQKIVKTASFLIR